MAGLGRVGQGRERYDGRVKIGLGCGRYLNAELWWCVAIHVHRVSKTEMKIRCLVGTKDRCLWSKWM